VVHKPFHVRYVVNHAYTHGKLSAGAWHHSNSGVRVNNKCRLLILPMLLLLQLLLLPLLSTTTATTTALMSAFKPFAVICKHTGTSRFHSSSDLLNISTWVYNKWVWQILSFLRICLVSQICRFEQKSANRQSFNNGSRSIGFAWDRVQNYREDTAHGLRHGHEAWKGLMNRVLTDFRKLQNR
jgi:hypothetical protein